MALSPRHVVQRFSVLLALMALAAAASPAAASAAVGYRDFAWAAPGVNGPSAEKPQSKLWFNDGSWWGDMFDVSSSSWRIFRLDQATQTWVNTGTRVDSRPASWADALWDGTHLYIASAGRSATSSSDSARLYRFSYSSSTKTYALDGGYPVTIVSGGMEAIVLDKDSTGALWATWTRNNQVYVNTTGSTGVWGTPFVIPVAGTTVSPDDLSSVVSFQGSIGVMWSNQVDEAMYFAVHRNGDPASTWTAVKKAVQGAKMADDHINLKSLQEINGQVFATVKTSLSDVQAANPSAPLILLLKRDPATGTWSNTTVSTVGDDQTRPIVMLSPSQDRLWVFATTPVGGGTINSGTAKTAIYYKTTSMSAPSFAAGRGTPFIQTAGDEYINNSTSTKQVATASSGVVVLASDNTSGFYMHGVIPPTATPAAPETTISSGPPASTTSTSATFAFASSIADSTFACSLDGASFTSCTSPATYSGLTVGSHTFAVRATSGGMTDATPATQTWTVQSPTQTSTLAFSPTDDATIDAGVPTTNFGFDTRVTADADPQRDFLLKFTIAGTGSGTSCPTVSGAKLRLTVGSTANDNADKGGEFRAAVGSNWSESSVTWNSAPAAAAGAPVAAITSTVSLNTTYIVDVSPLVTGNGTITIRAHGNSTDGTRYFSKDGNPAGVAPQLQVQCG
jgi:hypothetical protein